MKRYLRTAEVLAYLVAAGMLAASLNWANTVRHIIAGGGLDVTGGDAADRAWGYGIGAAVALAAGLIFRLVQRLITAEGEEH